MQAICSMCQYKVPILPQEQEGTTTGDLQELAALLLPIRKRMPQEAREVLNILINARYDLKDFAFCEQLRTVESLIATKWCTYFELK